MAGRERVDVRAEERLLDFLVKSGKASAATRDSILSRMVSDPAPAIELLEREGVIDQGTVARTVAEGLGLPLLAPGSIDLDESVMRLVDQKTAKHFRVVPIRVDRGVLVLAMENPFDQDAIEGIEFQTGRTVRPAVATRDTIHQAITDLYQVEGSLRNLMKDIPSTSEFAVVPSEKDEEGKGGEQGLDTEGGPVVKVVNRILVEAVERGASDVHIEPEPNVVVVRYRIHGILEDALQLPRWIQAPVTARIKVMAGLDITERRVPQDGRIRARHRDHPVDIRVSSLPVQNGEKIVMRILDPETGLRPLESLGFSPRDLTTLRKALDRPEGMILVTGPTGSGKTTTLYAIIREIASRELNVVTIENPVEYQVPGVNQVDIDERQGRTFAKSLRSILRQDPDVILVGEIRDLETAEVAFRAAQTGHLVFSTLHTNDAPATIGRLVNIGLERYAIASGLIAVLAQRLVRTVCPRCAALPANAEEIARQFGIRDPSSLRRGTGCKNCRKTGYGGRMGIYELLYVTDDVRRAIESGASESQVRDQARKDGMRTLAEDAVVKLAQGLTTPEEVRRAVQVEPGVPLCPECSNPLEPDTVICPHCHERLRPACEGCGRPLDPGWKMCPFCGMAMAGATGAGISPSVDGAEIQPVPPTKRPVAGLNPVRILVVDDDRDMRALLRSELSRSPLPIVVEEAADGETALEAVDRNLPHAILLDIIMPGIDGYEVCRRLRGDLRTAVIPILMLTARTDPEARVQGFLAGTDDYLVKPFRREEFLVRLHRLLQRTYGLVAEAV